MELQERDNRSIDDIVWAGGGGLTTADVLDAIESGPLHRPESGDVGLMLDEPHGKRALGVAYDAMSAPDAERLASSGVLRREHLLTAAALAFLQDNPTAGFTASVECFYDNAEGWWAVARRVGLANEERPDPSVLAAFAETFSQEPDGAPLVQSLMIMLSYQQGHRYAETYDYRAQSLDELPRAHLMPFPEPESR